MGCMVGVNPSPQLVQSLPYVDVFMPPSEATPLINHLRQEQIDAEVAEIERQQLAGRYRLQDEAQPSGTARSKHLALGGEALLPPTCPSSTAAATPCTFCIIPFRRAAERSRPLDEIVAEIRGLVDQGVREITLLGQIVDRYGYDWRGDLGNSATVEAFQGAPDASPANDDLAGLLQAVHEIDGLWRIRFLTSHPNYMTDRILHAVRDLPKVCEHIEVPIQAGSDALLERMKRGYTQADYRALVERIRAVIPNVAINTDIIVGFCGETDEHFDETVAVLRDLKLDKAHLALQPAAGHSQRPPSRRRRTRSGQGPPPSPVGGSTRGSVRRDQRPPTRPNRRDTRRGPSQGQVAGAAPEQARLRRLGPTAAWPPDRRGDRVDRAVEHARALRARRLAAPRPHRAAHVADRHHTRHLNL